MILVSCGLADDIVYEKIILTNNKLKKYFFNNAPPMVEIQKT